MSILPFHPDRGWTIYESMDYGYANPTAWLWTAVHLDGSIITFRELYKPLVTIEEWIPQVLEMRESIGRMIGVGDFVPALTVGDPSISRRDNGQSGISNQQAYARGGIYIATDGLVKMRSGNQNVGLDKMHQYLRPRPALAGPSKLTGKVGEPWWQITTDCPNLESELRRARKPKQTLKQKEAKNASEDIRDKDNHAIDAVKYLFMMTHDLRPPRWRLPDDERIPSEILEQYNPSAPMLHTHEDAFAASMHNERLQFADSNDYFALEG